LTTSGVGSMILRFDPSQDRGSAGRLVISGAAQSGPWIYPENRTNTLNFRETSLVFSAASRQG
jgi:hypothetical protein